MAIVFIKNVMMALWLYIDPGLEIDLAPIVFCDTVFTPAYSAKMAEH